MERVHKVLIVDDESWIVESMKDFLDWNYYGFEVIGQAYNGLEALEAIEKYKPEVVFTDVRMPEMGGLELIQKGKELPYPVQFVVVSGYSEFAYAKEALLLGAIAYCLKPFDENEFIEVLIKLKGTLAALEPPIETSIIHLLDDPSTENQVKLQNELKKYSLLEQNTNEIVMIVSIGLGDLPNLTERVIKLKTGTYKTAYILSKRYAEILTNKYKEGLPTNIRGLGISTPTKNIKEIKHRIDCADLLAYQYFIANLNGPFLSQSYKQKELNEQLQFLDHAIREKDNVAANQIFERMGSFFKEGKLSIQHALQVYNLTVSFLFKLGQTEHMLYNYEQLTQYFKNVFMMLDELKSLTTRYLRNSDLMNKETKNQSLNSILQFVKQNFYQEITLQSLGDQYHLNPSYISQLFRKEVGMTFTEYLAKLRIDYACELLDKSNSSVNDIAEKTGYHDYFYFTRVFKKMTGKTPTQYRKES